MEDVRQTDARQMVSVEAAPARTQPNNITLCKFDDIEIYSKRQESERKASI